MPVQSCSLNGKPGYQYGDSGTCYTYDDGNESSKGKAKQKAYVQGYAIQKSQVRDDQAEAEQADARKEELRTRLQIKAQTAIKKVEQKQGRELTEGEVARLLGLGAGGMLVPEKTTKVIVHAGERVAAVPSVRGVHSSKPMKIGGDGPAYSKAEVEYGEGTDEQECENCRFFNDGACQLVKGRISPEGVCRLFSPQEYEDLEREDEGKTAGKLTETQLAKFYELKDIKLDDTQGARRSWVPIFPEGHFDHPEYGDLDFTLGELRKYVLNFRKRVRKIDIAVDIDHKNEDAVGWLKDVDLRPGVGLFGLVEWNQHGAGLIADKRYRYISPQFGEYIDEESGQTYDPVIVALTITNFPFLKSMAAVSLRKKEGHRPTVTGRDKMATNSTKLKKAEDLDETAADAVAAEEDDQDEKMPFAKGKRAKKAKKTDELDETLADDDEEMADSTSTATLYDEEDVDGEFEPKSKPVPGHMSDKGKAASEPSAEIRRLTEANAKKDRRLRALELEMQETRQTLRLTAVREQARKLSSADGKSKLAYSKPVVDEFKKVALADKEAGNAMFRILSLVRQDGLVSLAVEGRTADSEDERNDPTGHGEKVLKDKKTGKPIVGLNEQRRAMMYATEHKLDWKNPEDRMAAYLAVSESDDDESDDESGYTREV